ncbi:MAG: hypothetical protein KA270_17400 [Saprospiraceae bacterium]|nr:hypothetical protein [Saprospiraceae bacterium]MBP6568955.1 hypothetical protein [Saprospiraceae bacterium]
MKTPQTVSGLTYIGCCANFTLRQWEELMDGTVKANGAHIRKLIKKHLPELYHEIALGFYNPHEHKSVKKKGLLVYVHSGIEYFLQFEN